MASATTYTNVDSYVDENKPYANYGQASRVDVSNTTSNKHYAYLWFPKAVPDGSIVTAATLHLFLRGSGWTGTSTVTIEAVDETWKENKINFHNRPDVRTTYTATAVVASGSDGDEVTFSLVDIMNEVAAGAGWFGVRVRVSTNGVKSFYSSDASDLNFRPTTDLVWNEGPLQPSDPRPSGGHATALALPTLTWSFQDLFGDIQQAKSRVQISTSTSFASPVYDSTLIANTLAMWDLSATAFGGFADNTTYYWRVMVQDDAGFNSDWSDTAQLERRSLGTSVLTAPTSTVEEIIPDITHSALSGRTQEATEYFLLEEDDIIPGFYHEVWHRERIATTATTISLPDGLIRTDLWNYKVVVRIYDTIERDPTPGDPGYVESSQIFQFNRSGAITGTASLVVTDTGPAVLLQWTRASTPDFFVIRVDDFYLDHDSDGAFLIPGADCLVSGSNYQLYIYGTAPRASHNYEVEAVVITGGIDKHSSVNDDEDHTHTPKGIWLVEPSEPVFVQFIATDEPDMSIGEDSSVYNPIGSRKPVVITADVRGYEGKVSGIINGVTYRDDFLRLKGQMNSKQLRLVFADINIPILMVNVVGPTPMRLKPLDHYYNGGFDFLQNGEMPFRLDGEN